MGGTSRILSARTELPNPALRLQFLVLSRGALGGQRAHWAFAQPGGGIALTLGGGAVAGRTHAGPRVVLRGGRALRLQPLHRLVVGFLVLFLFRVFSFVLQRQRVLRLPV